MKLSLDLPTDVSIALRRMAGTDRLPLDEAVTVALRDWLMVHGFLELEPVLHEDTETAGEA